MRIRDLIKISQTNLLRSKLRTFLTILAVFIGAFTISLTNGVGNGVRSYVDKQLGNVGAKNVLQVQAKQTQLNPVSSDVVEYDPEQTAAFSFVVLNDSDYNYISHIHGVKQVTPFYAMQIEYVTAGNKKFEAGIQQFIPGLNLDLAAGRAVDMARTNNELTIPQRYIKPLGFVSNEQALGQNIVVGYKDAVGKMLEKIFRIVGVQQPSLLGSSILYIHPDQAAEIRTQQTMGVALLENTYQAFFVTFDPGLTDAQIDELKQLFVVNNYTASTLQDQIGTVNKVIDAALIMLNIFGAIALLAAGFGIINTLLMAVNERTSEIGLMKALGANSRAIFSLFSLEAASIGLWGSVLGVGLSMVAGTIINHMAAKTFLKDFNGFQLLTFPPESTLTVVGGIVLLAFLAGSLPSIKASRLDPIKALRYE